MLPRCTCQHLAPLILVYSSAVCLPSVASAKPSAAPSPSPAPTGLYVQAELGLAVVSNREQFARATALAARAGYRYEHWGAFTVLEFNTWKSPEITGATERVSAVNFGLGASYQFLDGFARSALAFGASMRVKETSVDEEAGAIGVFADARPLGLTWQPSKSWRLGLDPLAAKLMIPVLTGIPLIEIQYMTTFHGEWDSL